MPLRKNISDWLTYNVTSLWSNLGALQKQNRLLLPKVSLPPSKATPQLTESSWRFTFLVSQFACIRHDCFIKKCLEQAWLTSDWTIFASSHQCTWWSTTPSWSTGLLGLLQRYHLQWNLPRHKFQPQYVESRLFRLAGSYWSARQCFLQPNSLSWHPPASRKLWISSLYFSSLVSDAVCQLKLSWNFSPMLFRFSDRNALSSTHSIPW